MSAGSDTERPSFTDSSEPSDLSSLSRSESPLALACGTLISLVSIAALVWMRHAGDLRDAPWWAVPAGIALATLPTSVRAGVAKTVVRRVIGRSK